MSEMKLHVAVRFVFSKEYEDAYDMYDLVRPILGNASHVSSNKDGNVSSFEYDAKKGNWCIYKVDNSNKWVADYILEDETTFDGDLSVSYGVEYIQTVCDKACDIGLEKYLDIDSGRVCIYTWYDGCDMPVEWKDSSTKPSGINLGDVILAVAAIIGVVILAIVLSRVHTLVPDDSNAVLDGGYNIGVETDDSFGGFEEDLDPAFSYGGE